MRIGLNATCFNDRPSGANQRFAGIYGAVIAGHLDCEFVIYEPEDCPVSRWFRGSPNVTVRRTPLPSTRPMVRTLGGIGYWPRALAQDRLDLFETFHLPLLRAPNCPTILTIHDARPVRSNVSAMKRLMNRQILQSGLRNADHVVTVSETMRQEMLNIEPHASVSVIYNGVDPKPFRNIARAAAESTRAKLDLPRRFLLAVGHLEERKNYLRLVEAISILRERGSPVDLVIVGNEGGQGPAIEALVERLGLARHVRLLEGISHKELAHLYACCELVVFPSTYEGFGLPLLEAMAARRPVVVSNIPVFGELAEGRLAHFCPFDPNDIAEVIHNVLCDAARQAELVSYGDRRIGDFTFPTLAADLQKLYRRIA